MSWKSVLKEHNNRYVRSNSCIANPLVSVVLPVHNVREGLCTTVAHLEKQSYSNIELIVVDDCSTDGLKDTHLSSEIPLIRCLHTKNADRNAARNTGIYFAKGEYVLVLDPDMIPSPFLIESLVDVQRTYGPNLYIGFRENLEPGELSRTNRLPDPRADFRFVHTYNSQMPFLSPFRVKESCSRTISIMDESSALRNFGEGRVIGAWDLAAVVNGHTMFFPRSQAIEVGGFDENYVGWGFDDIAFGALMMVNGAKVIPVPDAVSFHLNHSARSGSEERKWEEFYVNFARYCVWADSNQKHSFVTPTFVKTGDGYVVQK